MEPTRFSYLASIGNSEPDTSAPYGGEVAVFTASGTLLVGDAVYVSGVDTVAKSATAANYVGFVGFVVGGQANGLKVSDTVGTTACTTGQKVLVQISGITRGIVGATGFTAGTQFSAVPSAATAGRIIPGTTAGQQVGVVLNTQATAGAAVKILIHHR